MATYIGLTAKDLHTQAREYLKNIKRKGADESVLAEHHVNQHQIETEKPKIRFQMLCSTWDSLRLRPEEAYWIRRLQPALTRVEDNKDNGFLA